MAKQKDRQYQDNGKLTNDNIMAKGKLAKAEHKRQGLQTAKTTISWPKGN